jgi:hypothetical protein
LFDEEEYKFLPSLPISDVVPAATAEGVGKEILTFFFGFFALHAVAAEEESGGHEE